MNGRTVLNASIARLLTLFSYFMGMQLFAATPTSIEEATSQPSWWVYPLLLFLFTIIVGIASIVGGIGGGVLFIPAVSALFPFSIDFVRGTGLIVALTGALYASPYLLRHGLANFRLALPMALVSSTSAAFGAMVGLSLPAYVVHLGLGTMIMLVVIIMMKTKSSEKPDIGKADPLSKFLDISGSYIEQSSQEIVPWHIHRMGWGLFSFVIIGFLAGLFGLGAGFANIPVLNLVLGAPLKLAVGTSKFILSITDTTAAWVYLNNGAISPLIAIPPIMGMIIGTKIGVGILSKTKPKHIKSVVIVLLFIAGLTSLIKGLSH